MAVAHAALAIDDEHSRHPPQFKQIYFLVECFGHFRLDVGAADKRQLIFAPVSPESIRTVRPEGDDLGPRSLELSVILAQLCQVPAAVGSDETPQQHQNHRLATECA
jgi:hypothetical protein